MNTEKNKLTGRIQASLTALCFGLLGVFGKWAFANGFSVGELMAYRFLLASTILWSIILVFKTKWAKISLKQIGIFFLLGTFGYGAMSVTYLTSIKGLSITTAVLILYTYPFWVSLISHFFTDNKMTRYQAFCLMLGGIGLVFLLGGNIQVKEVSAALYGILSAVLCSFYIIFSEKFQNGTRPLISSAYIILFGAIALLTVFQPSITSVISFSYMQLFCVIGIALICTILPLTLELAALQKIQSAEFSMLMMLEPISAAMWGFLIFDDKLNLNQSIGAVIIILALTLRLRPQKS